MGLAIAPSIMCADLLRLGEVLDELGVAGADAIHVDVMDGHLVPGFTFGAEAVAQMRARTRLPLEVHLMSDAPLAHIDAFAEAGADEIVVPLEGGYDVARALAHIRRRGLRAGVALAPATAVSAAEELLDVVDEVLVMAVSPGFVGQSQIPACVAKAGRLADELRRRGRLGVTVTVDGGVKVGTIGAVAAAGAQKAVSGTGVFQPGRRVLDTLAALRQAAQAGATPPVAA